MDIESGGTDARIEVFCKREPSQFAESYPEPMLTECAREAGKQVGYAHAERFSHFILKEVDEAP